MRKRRLPITIDTMPNSDLRMQGLRWFLAIGLLQRVQLARCQFENFDPSVEPCPSDTSISGYTSVASINSDIDQEISRIDGGGQPQELYTLSLCPGTFDTTSGPLLPRLDRATYSCAGTGNVNEGCIFSGGEVNVRIEDPGISGYNVNAMNFLGITFTSFTGYSIELQGAAPTEAVFLNCLWQDFQSTGIAKISNDNNPPMDLQLDMCSIRSSSEDTADAVVDIAFENGGGSMLFTSVMVEGIQINTSIFRTLGNGATMVFESAFQRNSMTRLSEVVSGMADFSGVTIADNVQLLRMFEVNGEGSATLIQDAVIVRNTGEMAYQIFRITDGAEGRLLNSTIRLNSPVEYGMYVLAETEGTAPVGLIEDSSFEENTLEEGALVMSEGDGAFVDMSRNRFTGNTRGIMNLGAFFGGDIRFVSTCFVRNDHFLVALVLEGSEFEAFDNYVEDEVSQICSGMNATEGTGRLSVEQPGSMCFQGGDNCMVDCLPNANDSPVCLADLQTTSPMPSSFAPRPSSPPTAVAPSPTFNPSSLFSPTVAPTTALPITNPSAFPIPNPAPSPLSAFPTKAPTGMQMQPATMPMFQPLPSPTRRPSRPSKPTIRPPTFPSPHHCDQKAHENDYGYYGIGDCYDSVYPDISEKYANPEIGQPKPSGKQSKKPSSGSYKNEKDQKGSKKDDKSDESPSSSKNGYPHQLKYPSDPEHYGIGASEYYSSSSQYEKSQFGIGYTYAQPRTIGSPDNGDIPESSSSQNEKGEGEGEGDDFSGEGKQHSYGIGRSDSGDDEDGKEGR